LSAGSRTMFICVQMPLLLRISDIDALLLSAVPNAGVVGGRGDADRVTLSTHGRAASFRWPQRIVTR
jgi:hypothetical protein